MSFDMTFDYELLPFGTPFDARDLFSGKKKRRPSAYQNFVTGGFKLVENLDPFSNRSRGLST